MTDDQAPGRISRRRLILVDALVAVTTLLLILGMFSVWADRLLFNPNNWATTSTKLLQDPTVRSSTANFLVDRLYANVDVAGALRAGLPPRLEPLASPAAGALRNVAVDVVDRALQRPAVQNLWAAANRAAAQALVTVVNGGNGRGVTVSQGVVTLDLGTILKDAAARLGLPGTLVSKLPPNAATITVLKSHQLEAIENIGNAIKSLALWLTIFVPLLYVLAMLLARGHRRRTIMTIGFAAVLAGVLVFLLRQIMQTQIASVLTNDASLRPTITTVIAILTQILSTVAGAVVFTGLLLVGAAWLAGPARYARAARRWLAPYLHHYPAVSYGVTLGILILLFIWRPIPSMGTPAGIITFTALAMLGTYLLRRQTEREFPDARLAAG